MVQWTTPAYEATAELVQALDMMAFHLTLKGNHMLTFNLEGNYCEEKFVFNDRPGDVERRLFEP